VLLPWLSLPYWRWSARTVVVESQRPERVPFDLAAELYLKFNAVVVACRKAMRQPALATTDAIGYLASTHSS
jgi:hypothetical protein